MSLVIYTYPNNYRVQKALIAAQYNGVKVETPAFTIQVDNKKPEFLAQFPQGKVPAMATPHGPITESGAIARYVAAAGPQANLLGGSFYEQGLVNQWIDFCLTELEPVRNSWIYQVAGFIAHNHKAIVEAKKDLDGMFALLDKHLLNNTFLVGNQVTLADISVVCALDGLFKTVIVEKAVSKYTNLLRWFNTCVNQKEFVAVLGKFAFTKSEQQPAKTAAKKEEKPKKEEVKKEAPKKVEEPAPAPAKVHPLEALPPSPMHLDTVKKLFFSQKPYNPEFFEKFWEMFDAQGYSLWTLTTSDTDTMYFKVCNLMGGYLQRCDIIRKYAMGCLMVTGESEEKAPWDIKGFFILRGQELKDSIGEVSDTEYYQFTKLDASKPEDKEKVKTFLVADVVDGQNVLDRRYFK